MHQIIEDNQNVKAEKYADKIDKLKKDLAQLKAEVKQQKKL